MCQFTFLIWIGANPPSPMLIPAMGEDSLLICNFVLSSSVSTQDVFIPISLHFCNWKCQLRSFTKLCVHRPQIGTIGIVFASPCWFCNSVSRNSPKLDGCCWLFSWWLKISQVHALVGSSDWVKVLFIFWCPWQWKSIVPTTCSTNIYQIKSRTGKLFVYRF